jgi:hypothetical protein
MTGLFDASAHKAIAIGSCVMIADSEIVYAGPLQYAPEADGTMVLLNPDDYASLTDHMEPRH